MEISSSFFCVLVAKKSFPNMIIGAPPSLIFFCSSRIKFGEPVRPKSRFRLCFPLLAHGKKRNTKKGGDIRVGVTVLRENIVTVTGIFAVGRLAVEHLSSFPLRGVFSPPPPTPPILFFKKRRARIAPGSQRGRNSLLNHSQLSQNNH